jgi:pimeloyl-ACP methyl ester carboxylesterase
MTALRLGTYQTFCGPLRYWTEHSGDPDKPPLVFLPGLTADHRLFDRQIAYFAGRYRLMVWDPPGHAASWPFSLSFTLMDQARWLDGILAREGLDRPVLIGQSMGGYVAQAYCQLFPHKPRGFISIDSAPLQRQYVSDWELWLLKRMEPVYRYFPWRLLLLSGTRGVARSAYGRTLMRQMMAVYTGDHDRYARLCGHGFQMLAQAMEADLPYRIPCPALLLCGEKDQAGSCVRYNRSWSRESGIPLVWIPGAGHNSNTDQPELVNTLIQQLLDQAEAASSPSVSSPV